MAEPNEKRIRAINPNVDIDVGIQQMQSNEKTAEQRSRNTNRNDNDNQPQGLDFKPWQQLPEFIAMGLAIYHLRALHIIVATATPTLTNEFHVLCDIGWYGSAHRLTTCSTQFLFGNFYVKWVLISAVLVLGIGSIVPASARSSAAFIIGRAVSGCGAAGILNGVLIPICNSTVGGLECIAMIVVLVIGGSLTAYVTWRWCKIKALNIPSLSIFMGSIVCLLLALQWGGTAYSWSSGRAIAVLVVLRKDEATIPRSVVLDRTARPLPLWFQAIKSASAATSGTMSLPSTISLTTSAISSGFILSFLGSNMAAVGFGFLTAFTPDTMRAAWIGWQVLLATGIGLGFPMPWSAVQVALKHRNKEKEVAVGMAEVGFTIEIGAGLGWRSVRIYSGINLLREGLQGLSGIGVSNASVKSAEDAERVALGVYDSAVTRCFWVGVAAG
ncbi:uncharacterized protein BDV17DRAFT_280129 [Aspergillus undulatus]|uniref:uncharacterized protein n=1 Tax=Aspergillus undulatus TaxID=1810928 RepID=UPI003CCCD611